MSAEQPKRSSTGLEDNIAGLLCYLGGLITGIVFLVVEKKSKFVRFHAMQSTIVSVGAMVLCIIGMIVALVLSMIPFVGWVIATPFWLLPMACFGLFIFLMIKAYQGEMYKLPYVGEIAEQQMDKILK